MSEEKRPKVGVGVMIFKDGKVLLHKRKNKNSNHGDGQFAYPGGHLEYMESFEDCAKRETFEEAGIEIENVRFLRMLNMTIYAPKHYVHVTMIADWKSGDPKVKEPDKCEYWDLFDLDTLPSPLFATIVGDIKALKGGKVFFDSK